MGVVGAGPDTVDYILTETHASASQVAGDSDSRGPPGFTTSHSLCEITGTGSQWLSRMAPQKNEIPLSDVTHEKFNEKVLSHHEDEAWRGGAGRV